MTTIYLAEITVYDPALPGTKTLRYCTGLGYVDGVNGTYYEPRIEQPALMRREIFADGQIGGRSTSSTGELVLINNDGGLDALAGYAYDSRQLLIKLGDDQAAYSTFTTILKATMSQAAFEWSRVSVRIKDRMSELDKPIQPNKYTGTNSLPNGLEGLNTDIKDSEKPKIYGRVANMTPTLVNSSRLIYQVNDGAISRVVSVMDRGSYLSLGADYTSQLDMETNAPSAGFFRVWPAGGYIRIGSTPSGLLTATVWENGTIGTAIESNTAAQVAYRMATVAGGIIAGDTVAGDYTTLDGQNAGSIGLVCSQGQTIAEALDQVSASVGAWWGFDYLGRFRIARFNAPSGTAVTTFTAVEILQIERESMSVNGSPIPVWQVVLNHDINWTVQAGDGIAGVVPPDRRGWLENASRQAKANDSAVKTTHPLAQDITYDTLLAGPGYALPEATRRLNLFKVDRELLNVTVRVDPTTIAVLDIGAVVSVQINRFGLNAGKLFSIIGIETDYRRNQINLRLWG